MLVVLAISSHHQNFDRGCFLVTKAQKCLLSTCFTTFILCVCVQICNLTLTVRHHFSCPPPFSLPFSPILYLLTVCLTSCLKGCLSLALTLSSSPCLSSVSSAQTVEPVAHLHGNRVMFKDGHGSFTQLNASQVHRVLWQPPRHQPSLAK